MLAFKFLGMENPAAGEEADLVRERYFGIVEIDASEEFVVARLQAPDGITLTPYGDDFEAPRGWQKGVLYPMGEMLHPSKPPL